jgi:dTMP kinase
VTLVLLLSATHSPLSIAGVYGTRMLSALSVGLPFGQVTDRADRRSLIVRLEIVRCAIVASLPAVSRWTVYDLYPALYLLGCIESLVQPARQASVPHLVRAADLGKANSLLAAAMTLGQAAGFAIASFALTRLGNPRPLYLADAATFAVAAAIIARLGNLGGGVPVRRLSGVRRTGAAWAIPAVRPLLLLSAAVVFYVGMLNPALLPLGYVLAGRGGPAAYGLLQMCLLAGLCTGSLIIFRAGAERRLRTLAIALAAFGAAVLATGLSPGVGVAATCIAVAGCGNAVYSVLNQTALLAGSDQHVHGTVMAARFWVSQVGQALGLGCGAVTTAALHARAAFVAAGAGLLVAAAGATRTVTISSQIQRP